MNWRDATSRQKKGRRTRSLSCSCQRRSWAKERVTPAPAKSPLLDYLSTTRAPRWRVEER